MRQPAAILATGGNLFNESVDTTESNFHLPPPPALLLVKLEKEDGRLVPQNCINNTMERCGTVMFYVKQKSAESVHSDRHLS